MRLQERSHRYRRCCGQLMIWFCAISACWLISEISIAQEASPPLNGLDPEAGNLNANSYQLNFSTSSKPNPVASRPKATRYARHLLAKYDLNHNGTLQPQEWRLMHGHPDQISSYPNGDITLQELTRWITEYGRRKQFGASATDDSPVVENTVAVSGTTSRDESTDISKGTTQQSDSIEKERSTSDNESMSVFDDAQNSKNDRSRDQKFYVTEKRLPAGLPDWFLARDKDGDGQLTAGEYSVTGVASELAEFQHFDANGDGVITAKECVGKRTEKPAVAKTTTAQVLPAESPEKTPRGRRKPRSSKPTE